MTCSLDSEVDVFKKMFLIQQVTNDDYITFFFSKRYNLDEMKQIFGKWHK